MKQPEPQQGSRMLVVHGTPLVAEDLREILLAAGASDVQLARSLPDDPPTAPFDACLLSITSQSAVEPGLIEKAASIAVHVVLVGGFLRPTAELPPRFSVLSEPFSEQDVLAALAKARGGSTV